MKQTFFVTRLVAWLGLVFAVALTIIETLHNWGNWSDPAMWIVDYLACVILFVGAYLILRKKSPAGLPILSTGWGFACAMFWMAYFFIHAEFKANPDLADPVVETGALVLFIWTLVGLSLSFVAIFKQAKAEA